MTDQELAFQQQLDALKQAHPLPIVVERYGVSLRKSGRNFIGHCPFHDDRRPSFSVFLADSGDWAFHCHSASCGASGDLFRFVGLAEIGPGYSGRGSDFTAVLAKLGAADFKTAPLHTAHDLQAQFEERPVVDDQVREVWDVALGVAHQLLMREKTILDYLHERGFSNDVLAQWRFGWWPTPAGEISPVIGALYAAGYRRQQFIYARLLRASSYDDSYYEFFAGSSRLSGRIMCADLDLARRPAYLLARVLPWEDNGQVAKYLSPPDFAKPILGIDSLSRSDLPVALVEGFWNMITLRKWGVDSIAVSGANLSYEQAKTLQELARPIIPVRDMDKPNSDGIIPGLEALRSWQQAVPGLPDGIELPQEVDGLAVKDVNDLDRHADGRRIFRRLANRHGFKMKLRL